MSVIEMRKREGRNDSFISFQLSKIAMINPPIINDEFTRKGKMRHFPLLQWKGAGVVSILFDLSKILEIHRIATLAS